MCSTTMSALDTDGHSASSTLLSGKNLSVTKWYKKADSEAKGESIQTYFTYGRIQQRHNRDFALFEHY